jgi:F-type H+-transporting ATPase subunit gamma
MPSLKVIRKRIASTKATQKITRAMKMVAGARLTRAQQRIVSMRPYAVKTADVLESVARATAVSIESQNEPVHPLLARRPEKRALIVVFSGDRGLCGALNTNVNKATERTWREKADGGVDVIFATCGRKGREYLGRRQAKVARDFQRIYEGLDLGKAREVAGWLIQRFQRGECDAVYLVFNEFKSAIAQKVTIERLLPLGDPSGGARISPMDGRSNGGSARTPEGRASSDYIFEPDERSVLERLVPMYVEITLYRALLESQASFFGAQMTAMDAATRNAKDMIERLTLAYNRARQAAITKELMEIIGGAEALKD